MMTQDEIIEMAKQAGCIPRRHPEYWEDVQVFATPEVLQAFAKLVAAKEREACAKLVNDNAKACTNNSMAQMVLYSNATAIRARGEA
jgi:hypothetical protein